jgi:hypothetical protein
VPSKATLGASWKFAAVEIAIPAGSSTVPPWLTRAP